MKLSTDALKKLMSTWLKGLDKEDLRHYTGCDEDETPDQEAIDEAAGEFNFRKGASWQELLDHIYDLWCDGSKWKRITKNKLGDEWETWLCKTDYEDPAYEKARDAWIKGGRKHDEFPEPPKKPVLEFTVDVIGGGDEDLLAKFSGPLNEALARKCIYREFNHSNDNIANNYRLEVITTPEDDAVIGWCVTVD